MEIVHITEPATLEDQRFSEATREAFTDQLQPDFDPRALATRPPHVSC